MPAELLSSLVFLNIVGALIGAGMATYAEFFYTKAAADGIIDHHERKYLRHLFHGLSFGMSLVLATSIALIVLEYLIPNAPQDVLFTPFWALQTLTLFILVMSSLLSQKRAQWWFASASILTAWWMILLIDLGAFNRFSYLSLVLAFLIATFLMAGILGYARILLAPKRLLPKPLSTGEAKQ